MPADDTTRAPLSTFEPREHTGDRWHADLNGPQEARGTIGYWSEPAKEAMMPASSTITAGETSHIFHERLLTSARIAQKSEVISMGFPGPN
jgi:hypothetical protein